MKREIDINFEDNCFEECDCDCSSENDRFNKILRSELRLEVDLKTITHSGIYWYLDKSIDEDGISLTDLERRQGIYILWHKNDYCDVHDNFHMKALYVGKGLERNRIRNHWKNKDTVDEALIYVTFFPCENRVAKFLEQLFLDEFSFELNRAENIGTTPLCAYFSQEEVD